MAISQEQRKALLAHYRHFDTELVILPRDAQAQAVEVPLSHFILNWKGDQRGAAQVKTTVFRTPAGEHVPSDARAKTD